MILTGTQLYVMAVCSFLFLYWLSIRLDADTHHHRITVFQILLPLMLMSVLLMFIHPAMLYYSQQYQALFRESLAGLADFADSLHNRAGGHTSLLLE